MASPYEQYENLTNKEKEYVLKHPAHIMTIKESKEAAFAETKKQFGRNGRNDKSDAFRHCYWSALLSKELGYTNALEFTTAHESSPANIQSEKTMDLYNNKLGLQIGQNKKSTLSVSMQCLAALRGGKLKVIKP